MYDTVMETLRYCKYRVFSKGEDLEEIFRLRYDCYHAEGLIPKNERGTMSDPYDESPNCVHVAVEFGGVLLASVRLHLASDRVWETPTIEVFPDILDSIPDGQTMLDPTRFVVRPEAREVGLPLHFVALRIPFLAAMFYDIDVAIAPVRIEHYPFYRRYLYHDVWSMPRPYPYLSKPLGLLATKPKERRGKVLARYPFFGPINPVLRSEIYFPDLPNVFSDPAWPIRRVA